MDSISPFFPLRDQKTSELFVEIFLIKRGLKKKKNPLKKVETCLESQSPV